MKETTQKISHHRSVVRRRVCAGNSQKSENTKTGRGIWPIDSVVGQRQTRHAGVGGALVCALQTNDSRS